MLRTLIKKKKVKHTGTFFWNPSQQWEGRDRRGHSPGSFTCSSMRSRPMRDPVSRAQNGESSWGMTSDSNLWLWLGWAGGSFTQPLMALWEHYLAIWFLASPGSHSSSSLRADVVTIWQLFSLEHCYKPCLTLWQAKDWGTLPCRTLSQIGRPS